MSQTNPDKSKFKINEVCAIADTQPYVLRFWESEFPQLSPRKSRGGHPIYTRDDVDLVLRIKRLLHDQEFSLSDAREALAREPEGSSATGERVSDPEVTYPPATETAPGSSIAALENDVETTRSKFEELRGRYDTACEEIRHLKDALGSSSSLVEERDTARREAEALRERLAEIERLEHQLDRTRGLQRERDNDLKQLRARVDDLAATLEETAAERDRARERAEESFAEAERARGELDVVRAATRGERARLADRLESARAAFRELTRGELAVDDDQRVS